MFATATAAQPARRPPMPGATARTAVQCRPDPPLPAARCTMLRMDAPAAAPIPAHWPIHFRRHDCRTECRRFHRAAWRGASHRCPRTCRPSWSAQSPRRLRSAAFAGADCPISHAERYRRSGPRSGCIPHTGRNRLQACCMRALLIQFRDHFWPFRSRRIPDRAYALEQACFRHRPVGARRRRAEFVLDRYTCACFEMTESVTMCYGAITIW